MAILKEVNAEQAIARNRPYQGFAQDRPRAKVWGNYGIMMDGEFVPLPLGSPIDTMEPASVTGQNVAAVRLNTKKNKVLEAFKALGNGMAPGETRFIDVVFQLRRVSDDLEIVPASDELDVDGIVALLGAKKPELKAVEPKQAELLSPSKEELKAQIAALTKALKSA